MATIRKSVREKNKRRRRLMEGTPRVSTMKRIAKRQLKDFNNYVKRKFLEGQLKSHQEVGLPQEITGLDLENFEIIKEQLKENIDGTEESIETTTVTK